MEALVINLPGDRERLATVRAELAHSPFSPVTIVDGVDARRMTESQRRTLFDYDRFCSMYTGMPAPGEVGCALAHYKCWRRVAEAPGPMFILEDDVQFRGSWDGFMDVAGEWLSAQRPRLLLPGREFMYHKAERHGDRFLARNPVLAIGTECYGLNPEAARLLLGLGKPHYVADDWDYYQSRGLEMAAIFPHPVIHPDEPESKIGTHVRERFPWEVARRSVLPATPLFYFTSLAWQIFKFKVGVLKRHRQSEELI